MDIVISAVASELVSRFISFLTNNYRKTYPKKNLERLQYLLTRVHMVVEEAEGRYMTNSMMLMQLKMITEAMYQGYDVLDIYRPLVQIRAEEVSGSYTMDFPVLRRFCMTSTTTVSREVHGALEKLETTIANMKEFIMLLTGCDRMFRSPYSSYLYIDNFMFGRQVERQHAINIMVQDDNSLRVPTVLPIIGGCRVGKKTFVESVCADERIRSRFSSILHFNGDEIQKIVGDKFTPVRTLVIVEFQSAVDDKEWSKFYSLLVTFTAKGSKVIIISRLEKIAKYGTVNPIRINSFSREEYSYLFKVLAFGSSNAVDHPRLVLIGKELATIMEGSLVHLNVYTSVLRNNLNVQFWIRVLKLYRTVMEANFSLCAEHPKTLLEKGNTVDITKFSLSSARSVRIMLLIDQRCSSEDELPKMSFGDIIAGSVVLPMKFQLVWQSRLPPYNVISATCAAKKPQRTASPRKKRRRMYMSL